MARMLGTCQRPWCPICRTGCGPDCPDVSRSKGATRAAERQQWQREAEADEYAAYAAESLELAELAWPAAAEVWPEY